MVEVTGFEPAASCSQSKHSTKLSYTSILLTVFIIPYKFLIVNAFIEKVCSVAEPLPTFITS